MINVIWIVMLLTGIAVAAIRGQIDTVTISALKGAEDGVAVCLGLISILVFWLGLMRIAESAGLVQMLAKALRPIATWLYPSVPKDHPAMGSIMANMSANILGLGNAATPLGLKAMRELQQLNEGSARASDAMCTLLAVNTASLTLIPATVIALRLQNGSKAATEIVGATMAATAFATAIAIVLDRWYREREHRRRSTL